jgi:hypothetical protein
MSESKWAKFRGVGYLPPSPTPVPVLPSAWLIQALKGQR